MAQPCSSQTEPETLAQPAQPQQQALSSAFEKSQASFQHESNSQVLQNGPPLPQRQVTKPDEQTRPWNKGWHLAKLVLGTGSLVTSGVLLAISLTLLAKYGKYEPYGRYELAVPVAFGLATSGLAMLWITTEFLVLSASKTKHGIHPGASLSLHLIVSLVTAAGIGFTTPFLPDYVEMLNGVPDENGSRGDHADDRLPDLHNHNALGTIKQFVEVIISFMAILTAIHLVLFVRACVETYQYNNWKWEHAPWTVYVPVPMTAYGYYTPASDQGRMVFRRALAQQPQRLQPTTRGGPSTPAQVHLYGYYAPVQNPAQPAPQARIVSPPAEAGNDVASSSR